MAESRIIFGKLPCISDYKNCFSCRRPHRYYIENRSAPALLEFVGQKPGRNTKEVSRRAAVLNTVFLERITDILSSSKHDHGVHQHGFLVTKVLDLFCIH